ncbi:putative mitochondral 37S ribosomal protein S27 [Tricharina praecox]|uniref:putative mitochondral 37S ribosomal protein S27 n=1 Tax=Tricharina praecox TaxID=43433 RepID=UPI00221FBD07|nr:putative mitochondral 37S ribosomal protein S27 [Tricharina praecox]KAI5852211.1 putative mitochondral 37S ribosomal protein S27 [Tricharina praecox]
MSLTRLQTLYKLSASIFNTTFNPTNIRTGNKVLRQRLKGAALLDYYPPRVATVKDLRRLFPNLAISDDAEDARVNAVERAKARGKGAPKKVRVKPERMHGKKK